MWLDRGTEHLRGGLVLFRRPCRLLRRLRKNRQLGRMQVGGDSQYYSRIPLGNLCLNRYQNRSEMQIQSLCQNPNPNDMVHIWNGSSYFLCVRFYLRGGSAPPDPPQVENYYWGQGEALPTDCA